MSLKSSRRKCRCCRELFLPDYRNRERQVYCSKPSCRPVSKAASQRRWLRKAENRNHFRDAENVRRVQQWRKAHPGYWKTEQRKQNQGQVPDLQLLNPEQGSCNAPAPPIRTLQDLCITQQPAFVGLISMMTGSTLQDDIDRTARQLLAKGRDILGLVSPEKSTQPSLNYDQETSHSTRSHSADPG